MKILIQSNVSFKEFKTQQENIYENTVLMAVKEFYTTRN